VRTEPEVVVVEPEEWVGRAADELEAAIVDTVDRRGRCVVAISGGSTPHAVFVELAGRALPWSTVTLVQVDERVAALGSNARNLTEQRQAFAAVPVQWLPLPVDEPLDTTLLQFVDDLVRVAGAPPVIDVVHLGLGSDGHTASLVPGDPVLDVLDRSVAVTGSYNGTRRVTLTRPVLDRAALVIWLVRGADKAPALAQLVAGDPAIPAGLLAPTRSVIVTDTDAAARL
jgi:6-phosphogluconolactonase